MSIGVKDRPLVTFLLFAYNQERFIREAAEGAFAQTYSPLEVVLSDDCSSDRTFEIMREMANSYRGPHKIVTNRTRRNLGICGHLSSAVALSNGQLIVIAAGDDVSTPHRSERIFEAFLNSGCKARSVMSDYRAIDAAGRPIASSGYHPKCPLTLNNFLTDRFFAYGATQAVHREVFDCFGPLVFGVDEDQVLLLRALLLGTAVALPDPLVMKRVHAASVSGARFGALQETEYSAYRRKRALDGMNSCATMLQDYYLYTRLGTAKSVHSEPLTAICRKLRVSFFWWRFFGASIGKLPLLLVVGLWLQIPARQLILESRSLLRYKLGIPRTRGSLRAKHSQ